MIPAARKIATPYIPPCLRRRAQVSVQTQMFEQRPNSIEEFIQIAEYINWDDKQNLAEELITQASLFLYSFLEKSNDISETNIIRIIRIIEKVEHTEPSFLQLVRLVCSGRFKNENPIVENKLVFLLNEMLTGKCVQALQAEQCQSLLIQAIKSHAFHIDIETLIEYNFFYINDRVLNAASEFIIKISKNSKSIIALFKPYLKDLHISELKSVPELNSTITEQEKLFNICLMRINKTNEKAHEF